MLLVLGALAVLGRGGARRGGRARPRTEAAGDDHAGPSTASRTSGRETWQGLGFGYAYAFAEDNLCTIADSYVTVSAERSRYFGPDETRGRSPATARVNKNLDSDFFYARINESGIVEDLMSRPPPEGPAPELRRLVRGYVAGYNAYLRDAGVAHIPDPRCRGADWVRPITELDVYRRFHQLGSLASSGAAIDRDRRPPRRCSRRAEARGRRARARRDAVGRARRAARPRTSSRSTAARTRSGSAARRPRNGKGMVLGNPHFPWDGAERLYQAQLTIPGKLDVTGGSLYGVPAVLIGQNRRLAWSHTVASAWRFTPFELTLVPGDPHSYLVDGQAEADGRRSSSPSRRRPPTARVEDREPGRSMRPSTGRW